MATSPKKLLSTILSISFLFLLSEVHGSAHHHHHRRRGHLFQFRPSKLFVFGDSYVDTGNMGHTMGGWREPYGMTFPGEPAGRFSDGRVLTDYLARFIGIKSPIPYKFRRVGGKHLQHGMNYAYGGTGVLDTMYGGPNMTTQIDLFQGMIRNNIFTPADVQSSVALVCLAGNDYSTHLAQNGSSPIQGWMAFITKVVGQLVANLQRIHSLGIKRIAVNSLEPLGCLPSSTSGLSYRKCNDTQNALVTFHNLLLQQAVTKLNKETKEPTVILLDLYTAFVNVLMKKPKLPGSSQFQNPLKPCCLGKTAADRCGYLGANGEKNYTVCEDRTSAFFWDQVHPTQEGWRNVYVALQATLEQL